MYANTPQRPGKGDLLSYYGCGLTVFSLSDKIQITRYVYMSRACLATRNYITFPIGDRVISCFPIHKCSSGANLHAGKAKLASRVLVVAFQRPGYSIAIQFNEIQGVHVSQISTSPDAPPTSNAQIIIQVEEGIVSVHRQSPILIRDGCHLDIQIVSHLLQFTAPVFRTGNTAFGDCYIPQTDIKRLTPFLTPASKASIGMLR